VVAKTFSSLGAHAGGAWISPEVRTPATKLAKLDIINVRRSALLKQGQEFVLRPVMAAHAGVAFRPDDEVKCSQAEFLSGCNDCGITSPIDEGTKETAIAKMGDRGPHPIDVKRPELGVAHFAAGHFKFTVPPARYMASNRHVVWLIGKQQPRLLASHENFEDTGIGRIAADEAVLTDGKNITDLRDRPRIRVWGQRTCLNGCWLVFYDNLVHLKH
jgi:hypothetical protein